MVASTLTIKEDVYIYPTDTVWGIGGSIYSQQVYKEISLIKKTNERKPLSVLCSGLKQLRQFIDIPSEISDDWLNKFYSFESTLALPKKWVRGELPEWVCYDSDYISIRCLDIIEVKELIEKVGTPITSTSLNITSKDPITNSSDAKKFLDEYAKNCTFVSAKEAKLSGMSSTIIAYDGKGFQCFRKGFFFNEIEGLLEEIV